MRRTAHYTTYCQTESPGVMLTFNAGATTKPPPGPLRAGIDGFTPKIEPLNVSHHLWEQVIQSIPGAFITPLQHHRPYGPQHEQTQIDPNDLPGALHQA